MTTLSLHTTSGRKVQILVDQEIGSGAEGAIYPVADSPHVCAKIYTDFDRAAALGERMDALTRMPPVTWGGDCPEHLHTAWPRASLRDGHGDLRGVVMPRIEGTPLLRLRDPLRRVEILDEPTWRTTFAIAARAGRLFDMLHSAGVVVGDVSPSNVLVDRHGHVTLLDCDGVQFTDPLTGTLYRGEKFTPEYAAPEVLRGTGLTREHDLFGLGVMVCELLMEGEHPFGGVSTERPPSLSVEENIKRQNNRVTRAERLVASPDALTAEILPARIHDLIRGCFEDGFLDPARRPGGQAWAHELDQAGYELMGCRYNPRHAYHRSAPSCIWCARILAGYGDQFPPPPGWVTAPPPVMASVPSEAAAYPAPPAPVSPSPARSFAVPTWAYALIALVVVLICAAVLS
ncbi:protein kinase [Actinoplanes sp. NPDC023714]|uniref:protein kinase domain-containing protein n=1 Tax=Actinoplanes sp. NPDC023714 TaxID=3154322 RepID=UPI0033FD0A46